MVKRINPTIHYRCSEVDQYYFDVRCALRACLWSKGCHERSPNRMRRHRVETAPRSHVLFPLYPCHHRVSRSGLDRHDHSLHRRLELHSAEMTVLAQGLGFTYVSQQAIHRALTQGLPNEGSMRNASPEATPFQQRFDHHEAHLL